jgi:hypothetical protein
MLCAGKEGMLLSAALFVSVHCLFIGFLGLIQIPVTVAIMLEGLL